ncbi:M57 family metalloprotease [Paenibacillus sp. SC116]|nr:M57 family metalloprotease [Paenibacillus sp. SC116]
MSRKMLSKLLFLFIMLFVVNGYIVSTTEAQAQNEVTVNFSGVSAPIPVNVRSAPNTSAAILEQINPNTRVQFSAWTRGQSLNDYWLNTPDDRWFIYIKNGVKHYVSSAFIYGNPPESNPNPTNPLVSFTVQITTTIPELKQAWEKAIQNWNETGLISLTLAQNASITLGEGYANGWDGWGWWQNYGSGHRGGAVIQWNRVSNRNAAYLEALATHEIGHTIKLEHSSGYSIMNNSWLTSITDPTENDRNELRRIYGRR